MRLRGKGIAETLAGLKSISALLMRPRRGMMPRIGWLLVAGGAERGIQPEPRRKRTVDSNHDEQRMTFLEHLEELRSRLVRAVLAIFTAFAVFFYFSDRLFGILAAPIAKLLPKESSLVFTSLPAPFFMYMKISFIAGLFVAFPYVLYQLWQFVRPGLTPRERKLVLPFVATATALFYAGGAFAYFLVFPAAFKFFLGFQTAELKPMIAIKEYVSLVMVLMLAFGVAFETPIGVVFVGLLRIFNSRQLKKGRRYFIVIAFVVAAVLTPTPDPINQALMAGPMILLYELGIWLLVLLERRRERDAEEASLADS